jgi:hypothetical protein
VLYVPLVGHNQPMAGWLSARRKVGGLTQPMISISCQPLPVNRLLALERAVVFDDLQRASAIECPSRISQTANCPGSRRHSGTHLHTDQPRTGHPQLLIALADFKRNTMRFALLKTMNVCILTTMAVGQRPDRRIMKRGQPIVTDDFVRNV